MIVFGILVYFGVPWVNQPQPNQPPGALLLDPATLRLVCIGAIAFSSLGLFLLLWRYLHVRKVLTKGQAIQGLVEDISIVSTESNSSDKNRSKAIYRRSYYANILYTFQNKERKITLKLPNSGFVYGLAKGRETELMG